MVPVLMKIYRAQTPHNENTNTKESNQGFVPNRIEDSLYREVATKEGIKFKQKLNFLTIFHSLNMVLTFHRVWMKP